jgi:hypothetical protein
MLKLLQPADGCFGLVESRAHPRNGPCIKRLKLIVSRYGEISVFDLLQYFGPARTQ